MNANLAPCSLSPWERAGVRGFPHAPDLHRGATYLPPAAEAEQHGNCRAHAEKVPS